MDVPHGPSNDEACSSWLRAFKREAAKMIEPIPGEIDNVYEGTVHLRPNRKTRRRAAYNARHS